MNAVSSTFISFRGPSSLAGSAGSTTAPTFAWTAPQASIFATLTASILGRLIFTVLNRATVFAMLRSSCGTAPSSPAVVSSAVPVAPLCTTRAIILSGLAVCQGDWCSTVLRLLAALIHVFVTGTFRQLHWTSQAHRHPTHHNLHSSLSRCLMLLQLSQGHSHSDRLQRSSLVVVRLATVTELGSTFSHPSLIWSVSVYHRSGLFFVLALSSATSHYQLMDFAHFVITIE